MLLDITTDPRLGGFAAGIAAPLAFGQQRLLKLLEGLTPELLTAVPAGLSNSIATLVLHVAGTEVRVAHMIRGEKAPEALLADYLLNQPQNPLPAAAGETVASLTAKVEKARGMLLDSLATVREEQLDQELPLGGERKVTLRWLLALLPAHQSQHFGQIQYIVKLTA